MSGRVWLVACLCGWMMSARAGDADDPFTPYLDGLAPVVVREVPLTNAPPPGVSVRQVVLRLREGAEAFAVVAKPMTAGPHPGILVLHGGGGCAEAEKAFAWAQRGYVAVAPDLPGIGHPDKIGNSAGRWRSMKYGEGRYVAAPDVTASVLFDAVLSGLKALDLLRAQPDVDASRIGVVGISWGGYMTTMVCGLAGDRVKAGFAVFGCGFYEKTSQLPSLLKMSESERSQWMRWLDAGRRAPHIRAAFFTAGAANDFFYWPQAVQATLDAIPGEKNHLYAPNANHKVPLPGGTVFPKSESVPFVPTPFQPYPTPRGGKANWLAMEVPYFEYYLEGKGSPLPRVEVEPGKDVRLARISVKSPRPVVAADVWWAAADSNVMKRVWHALPMDAAGDASYQAQLPAEAADWFAVVSDDRPVTVSGNLMAVPAVAADKGQP